MSTGQIWEIESTSLEQTEQLAVSVGQHLRGGEVIVLVSDLGGGKTTFVKGLVKGGGSNDLVTSPSFVLHNIYIASKLTFYHFDFYRLASGNEIAELGFDDYFQDNGVCIAEWSERLGDILPPDHLSITFEHDGGDRRKIVMQARGTDSQTLLAKIKRQMNSQEFL